MPNVSGTISKAASNPLTRRNRRQCVIMRRPIRTAWRRVLWGPIEIQDVKKNSRVRQVRRFVFAAFRTRNGNRAVPIFFFLSLFLPLLLKIICGALFFISFAHGLLIIKVITTSYYYSKNYYYIGDINSPLVLSQHRIRRCLICSTKPPLPVTSNRSFVVE